MSDKKPKPFSFQSVGKARSVPAPGAAGVPDNMSTRQRLERAQLQAKSAQHAAALSTLKPLLDKRKPDPAASFIAAGVNLASRRFQPALKHAKIAHAWRPNEHTYLFIARANKGLGNTDECVKVCDQILAKQPENVSIAGLKAAALEDAGRVDDAYELLAPMMESGTENQLNEIRDVWARVLVQRKRYDEAVEIIDSITEDPKIKDVGKSSLLHLKAKAFDRSKRYDDSWDAAEHANVIGRLEYDPGLHSSQVQALKEIWSREQMETYPLVACESVVPVFVAGMPRSGTSLIDQIIDAHPKASGVGELSTIESFATRLSKNFDPTKSGDERLGDTGPGAWNDISDLYLKTILDGAPRGAERIVNKALGNNKLLGLISRLFPKTRIIHAVRDPRDVSISCFMGGFNNEMHPWTSRVDWTAHAWALSQELMDHWKATLDIPIIDVHYERLVADPQNEFPRLIEFLGLDFDPSCYDFHKSERTVRTLSYDQVNRPLYTTSSGRHKNYERHIEGVSFPPYDPWA